LGIIALRGSIQPVYSFGALLGNTLSDAGRWLLLTGNSTPVGLVFAEFDRLFRVSHRDLARHESTGPPQQYVRELIGMGDVMYPVIDLASVVGAISQNVSTAGLPAGVVNHGS
jgi:chemotaxis signal transduction protein